MTSWKDEHAANAVALGDRFRQAREARAALLEALSQLYVEARAAGFDDVADAAGIDFRKVADVHLDAVEAALAR